MAIVNVLMTPLVASPVLNKLATPILLEEAKAAGKAPTPKGNSVTPTCDKLKAVGQWNDAWNPFFELDPTWTEQFMAVGA